LAPNADTNPCQVPEMLMTLWTRTYKII
jgi:hypothetical protein